MMRMLIGVMTVLVVAGAAAVAQQTQPAAGEPIPGLTVHREAGYIDLDATVVGRGTEWLELIACSPKSREHESIVTVTAKPSHIHLALLTLGLEPGAPLSWEGKGEDVVVHPPHGPVVEVFFVVPGEAEGPAVEVPANRWVLNRETGEPLGANRWLFAGSVFRSYEGRQIYMADLNGTVVSLVSFGDDLLVRPTTMTNQTDQQVWQANAELIPPEGTRLTLRLRPVVEEEAE